VVTSKHTAEIRNTQLDARGGYHDARRGAVALMEDVVLHGAVAPMRRGVLRCEWIRADRLLRRPVQRLRQIDHE
jgi:hypothetical protein